MCRLGALLGVLSLLVACAGSAQPVPQEPTRSSQEVDILESIYRYQFEHNASSATALHAVGVYFLSFAKDQDPPPGVLSRFAGHDPLVAPISEEDQASSQVTHKSTGGRGVILRVKSIRWIDGDTVEVEGGYYEGNRSASGNTYRAKRREGKWTIVDDVMHWIS